MSIEPVLREWTDVLRKLKLTFEFVVCEDGSTDGTSEFLRKIKNRYNMTLDQSVTRRGYGGAVLSGIHRAKYPLILCVDSDGQCDPNDLKKFLASFRKNNVLIGWRTQRSDASQRILFSKCFKLAFTVLFPNTLHDPSAPYVLFEKRTVQKIIPLLRYLSEGFWWGFVGACLKSNIPMVEIPVHHRKRFIGDTQVYKPRKIPGIALRNLIGLLKLRTTQL